MFIQFHDSFTKGCFTAADLFENFKYPATHKNSINETQFLYGEHEHNVLESVQGDSRYYHRLDKLGKTWWILANRLQKYHENFLEDGNFKVLGASARGHDDLYSFQAQSPHTEVLASPLTTPTGALNLVTKLLESHCPATFMSATCLSVASAIEMALHSPDPKHLIFSGECVGSEFKRKMFKDLGVFQKTWHGNFANKSFAADRDGMVLGDGASVLAFSKQKTPNSQVEVLGVQTLRDPQVSLTGMAKPRAITSCIDKLLEKVGVSRNEVNCVIGHGSATKQGDAFELKAYEQYFQRNIPKLLSTKWLSGHILGGSMGLSIVLACEMMRQNDLLEMPYPIEFKEYTYPQKLQYFLVGGMGYNGQVAFVLLKRV